MKSILTVGDCFVTRRDAGGRSAYAIGSHRKRQERLPIERLTAIRAWFDTPRSEGGVAASATARNTASGRVEWRFTAAATRINRGRRYPSVDA